MIGMFIAATLAGSAPSLPASANTLNPRPTPGAAKAEPMCQNLRAHMAGAVSLYDATRGEAKPQRLDRLPPADHVLTVLRTEDGCSRPVVVRYGIGNAPTRR